MASPSTIDALKDAALDELATATRVSVCSAEPANFAGIAAVSLATYTLTAGTGGADWSIADGATDGRSLTMAAQTGNNGTATGVSNFVVWDDGTTLLAVRDGNGSTVNDGSAANIAATVAWTVRDETNV